MKIENQVPNITCLLFIDYLIFLTANKSIVEIKRFLRNEKNHLKLEGP